MAAAHNSVDERAPLLPHQDAPVDGDQKKTPSWVRTFRKRVFNVENRILFAGFFITLAFSYTQVPLLYVFRAMTCDEYYDTHPPHQGPGDRCSIDAITAGTATQFSILGMSTTICGTMNLFATGWSVKKFGPRFAILAQTLVPAIRVATQILGVVAGKQTGMVIIQATQLITVIGGPAGYILVVNIFASESVEPARRTAVFGMLQGAIMLGQGIGYLAGGMIGDAIDIRAPFDVACVSFLLSAVYARLALPYIPPEALSDGKKPNGQSISGFLAPLKLLVPRRMRLADGRINKHHGLIFLCAGIGLGVIATSYAPLLIQLYATAAFDFDQAANGWLMSEFALMRSIFLIFMFPPIISGGRKWVFKRNRRRAKLQNESDEGEYQENGECPQPPTSSQQPENPLPTDPGEFDASAGEQTVEEPVEPSKLQDDEREGYEFDLIFLRWSLIIDGGLTTIAAYATTGWHIYLAAFLLPLGSGSAPAAKGVITAMCPNSQRADALNLVTLVENISRLVTQGLFGFIFAALAQVGKAYATFFCNAAIAVIAMGVLLFSNFPPPGSALIDEEETEEDGGNTRPQ